MKKIINLAILGIAFAIVITNISSVLQFKYGDGILSIQYLYEQEENSIDVLALGSSHAFEDINTGWLYDTYGISAYVLAGSVQPYWNSYYYLREALETQNPKLVLLEAYGSVFKEDYSDNSRIIKNNLGIRNIGTLIESIGVSSPEEEFDNYLFNYRLWHSRYEEISRSDFKEYYEIPKFKYYKGFGVNFATKALETPKVDHIMGESPMSEKVEIYYRKIIELCQENEIPIMVVVSPYVLSEDEKEIYNYTKRIAEEYGVDFIDFNSTYYYEKMNLDFVTDMADSAHLNHLGNIKYTEVLAEEILTRYELEDHRGDIAYKSWELHSKDIAHRYNNNELRESISLDEFIAKIDLEDEYLVGVYTSAGIRETEMQDALSNLTSMSWNWDRVQDGEFYILQEKSIEGVGNGLNWEYEEEYSDYLLKASQKFISNQLKQSLMWNGKEYIDEQNGCYLLVYDKFEEEMVCVRQIKMDGNGEYVLVKK